MCYIFGKVEQLNDGMIRYLSSLPNRSYEVLKNFLHVMEAELNCQSVCRRLGYAMYLLEKIIEANETTGSKIYV